MFQADVLGESSRTRSWLFVRVGGVVVTGLILSWCVAAFSLDRYGQRPLSIETYDAIVVAGCRVMPGGRPSVALHRRTARAVKLFKQGVAPKLVLTGGVGDNPPSEASVAAELAHRMGVPRQALVLEERSTSTEENARFAAEMLPPGGHVVVVTDAFHVFRAERVFARHFSSARGVGTLGIKGARVHGAFREVLALGYYGVRGLL